MNHGRMSRSSPRLIRPITETLSGKGDPVMTFIFALTLRLVIAVITALNRRRHEARAKALCNECAFAHIQFGTCGRRAISCTYGGGMRPMKLAVLYCTDYRTRTAPVRSAIGFIQEIASAE